MMPPCLQIWIGHKHARVRNRSDMAILAVTEKKVLKSCKCSARARPWEFPALIVTLVPPLLKAQHAHNLHRV